MVLDRRSSRYGADGDVLCCKMVLARASIGIHHCAPGDDAAAGCIYPGVSSRDHFDTLPLRVITPQGSRTGVSPR